MSCRMLARDVASSNAPPNPIACESALASFAVSHSQQARRHRLHNKGREGPSNLHQIFITAVAVFLFTVTPHDESNLELWISNFWIPEVVGGSRANEISMPFDIAHTCHVTDLKGSMAKVSCDTI
jgi:hypothetical protein